MKSKKSLVVIFTLTVALLSNGATLLAQEKAKAKTEQKDNILIFSSQDQAAGAPRAQTFTFVAGQEGQNVSVRAGDNTFAFVSSEMAFDVTPVKGAPYSAEAVTESIQSLADGNRIVRKSSANVYRDSEGRTRREETIKPLGPYSTSGEDFRTVFINDPVSGTSYTLNSRNKTAHKHTLHIERFNKKIDKAEVEEALKGKLERAEREAKVAKEAAVAGTFEFRTEGGGAALAFGPHDRIMWLGGKDAKKESLGTQLFDGVQAEGTRTTITIPAGQIGNDLPINIVSERWYSAELQTVVMSKHSDPRFGETIYRLANISRSEPSPSLFEIPADYTLEEMKSLPRMPRARVRENIQ